MFSFKDRVSAGAVLPPTSSRSPIELDLSCQDDTKEHFEKKQLVTKTDFDFDFDYEFEFDPSRTKN